ncbi:hypothetical protein ABW19_dt0200568 [Dactylella cylindrospora]|nr:hypothetical protein ABW19_dt0200568 [Dactylella cylindrospora]
MELKLKTLRITQARFLERLSYRRKLRSFNPANLESLSLVNCNVADDFLLVLSRELKSLRSLQVMKSAQTRTMNQLLSRLPPLKKLYFSATDRDLGYILHDELERHKDSLTVLWIDTPRQLEDHANWRPEYQLLQYFNVYHSLEELAIVLSPDTLDDMEFPPNLQILRILIPHMHCIGVSEGRYEAAIKQFLMTVIRRQKPESASLKVIALSHMGSEYGKVLKPYFAEYYRPNLGAAVGSNSLRMENIGFQLFQVTFDQISRMFPESEILGGKDFDQWVCY